MENENSAKPIGISPHSLGKEIWCDESSLRNMFSSVGGYMCGIHQENDKGLNCLTATVRGDLLFFVEAFWLAWFGSTWPLGKATANQ